MDYPKELIDVYPETLLSWGFTSDDYTPDTYFTTMPYGNGKMFVRFRKPPLLVLYGLSVKGQSPRIIHISFNNLTVFSQ